MKKFLAFGFFFLFSIIINTHTGYLKKILIVRINGTPGKDCDFAGNRAIEDAIESITNASEQNRYEILIYPGVYRALKTKDFNSFGSYPGNYSFIRGKDYVSIKGTDRDKVVIKGELPDDLGEKFSYASYSTIFWNVDHANIENLTVTGKNLRYPIHIDGGRMGMANAYTLFRNLKVIHFGNSGDALNWKSWHPVGLGMSNGQIVEIESSIFQSLTWPLYMHTNKNFTKKSILIIRNSQFVGIGNKKLLAEFQSLGSHKNDEIILRNDIWKKGYIIQANDWPYLPTSLDKQSYNHCDFKIKGSGNSPFLWESSFKGEALKITSKSVGGTVRFDTSSSAFPLILKDKDYRGGKFINYNGEINYEGYAYRDGSGNINGYAIGRLDVGEEPTYANTYIKSLGKRLGNCSAHPKTLVVIIDGNKYTIVFNKNYAGAGLNNPLKPAAYSDEQIINEIDKVIGFVADVSLYSVGNDYYPEFSDYLDTLEASEDIQRGIVVVKGREGKIRMATRNNKGIFGVALDDIIAGKMGRVLKKGYISTDQIQRFHVCVKTNLLIKKGKWLGIGRAPGILSKSISSKFFYAINDSVLAFNLGLK